MPEKAEMVTQAGVHTHNPNTRIAVRAAARA